MKKTTLICDMQYGSTGKGLIAGYIAKREKPDLVITAWGANAGHTFVDDQGRSFVSTMVANSIVSQPETILIAPGSIINPENLLKELNMYRSVLGSIPPVLIHENATIITENHRSDEEKSMVAIGSTRKGVGAAVIQKIARNPDSMNVAKVALKGTALEQLVISAMDYEKLIEKAHHVLIEGAQGFDLGINSGFYPYVTSRECTPAQILADCCVPITPNLRVVGVMRTFPIRVANRYDEKGNQIGFSGPGYPDQKELAWSDIGIAAELTTVTKLPRRIFQWSSEQCRRAIRQCNPTEVFLNFCNYVDDRRSMEEGTPMSLELGRRIADIESAGSRLRYLGYGPSEKDVFDFGSKEDQAIRKEI